jgi:hypothetical protein
MTKHKTVNIKLNVVLTALSIIRDTDDKAARIKLIGNAEAVINEIFDDLADVQVNLDVIKKVLL